MWFPPHCHIEQLPPPQVILAFQMMALQMMAHAHAQLYQ
jgi:hypothetical protein